MIFDPTDGGPDLHRDGLKGVGEIAKEVRPPRRFLQPTNFAEYAPFYAAANSRKGDCWDNAVVESFNAPIKTELINRTKWITREEARAAVYKWIETWYNSKRLHSTLVYRSPDDFESDEKQSAA
jgi:hypothetical protein